MGQKLTLKKSVRITIIKGKNLKIKMEWLWWSFLAFCWICWPLRSFCHFFQPCWIITENTMTKMDFITFWILKWDLYLVTFQICLHINMSFKDFEHFTLRICIIWILESRLFQPFQFSFKVNSRTSEVLKGLYLSAFGTKKSQYLYKWKNTWSFTCIKFFPIHPS